jgi:membrane protease YdiL (CAAX protease family)
MISVESQPVASNSRLGQTWREVRLIVVAALVALGMIVVIGVAYGIAYGDQTERLTAAFDNAASVPSSVAFAVSYGVLAAFLLWRLPPTTGRSLRELGIRTMGVRDWKIVAVGVIALAVGEVVQRFLLAVSGQSHHQQAGFEHIDVTGTAAGVLFFSVTAFGAPIAEELFFRVLLFRTLVGRMPWVVAAIVSALAFGALHGDLVFLPEIAWMGFVNAVAYYRSGSIATSVILHGVNNGVVSLLFIFT